ncbi:hypothetical protein FRC01_010227 [Tulasnella sp. 417]|nr:hypothetical protein FRC01_010227 [Tulasnella sp. 417]
MPADSTDSTKDDMDRIDAIKTAREHFSYNGTPAFHARLKVSGQQVFGADEQHVSKANWANVVPRISILLLRQATPAEVKKETAPIPAAKPKNPNKLYPAVSAKHQVLGKKVEQPKVVVVITYGKTLKKSFAIRPYKPLETIFNEFAGLVGEDRDVLRFYFDGNRLDDHSTVNSFHPGLGPGGATSITAAKILNIILRNKGVSRYFSITSNKSFRVLERGWAKAQGVKIGEFLFRYKGKVLALDLKPHDYGIDSGDIIDVV